MRIYLLKLINGLFVIQKLYRSENKDTLTEVYRTVLLVIERQDSEEIVL